MKKILISSLLAASALFPATASTWSLSDIFGGLGNLGKGDSSNVISNVIEGVLTKTDISVADMAGEWTATGSAVSFKSENLLAKAGGVAAAATIESKLDPYYKQYGLTGSVFNINTDGSFTMTVKKVNLKGTITKNADNTFQFKFSALGSIPIGSITAYVQKSVNKLEIMFDASKLKSLISTIAKFSGMNLAKTAASLLDSYDGLCVGFSLSASGNASDGSSSNSIGSLLGGFGTLFGQPSSGNSKSDSEQTEAGSGNSSTGKSGSGNSSIGSLKDLINKKK